MSYQSYLNPLINAAPSLLTTGAQTAVNQGLQNNLINSAVTNLQDLAGTIANQGNPDLTAYINTQIQLLQQGKITPATAMSGVQGQTQLYNVKVPQNFTDATNQALSQEQQISTQGYTPVERAAIQNALQGVIQQQNGQEAAIASAAQARGQYGSGQKLDLDQQALQGEINNASTQGNATEAAAYQRALAAVQASGQLGLTAGQQSFSQNTAVATAQDAINNLNTQLTQQANLANTTNQQQATITQANNNQARDLANQQTAVNLNQQEVNAANQTVTNKQNQENLVGSNEQTAAKDATSIAIPVYGQTQNGVSAINQTLAGAAGGLTKALTGSGSGNANTDPFAGTYLANNTGARNTYNQNNGPTSGEINQTTGNYAGSTTGVNTPITVEPIDTGPTPVVNTGYYAAGGPVSQRVVARTVNPVIRPPMARPPMVSAPQPQAPAHTNAIRANIPVQKPNIDGYGAAPKMSTVQPVNMNRASFDKGGNVRGPGSETSDDIPAYLSNHEFVVKAENANKYRPVLQAINDGDDSNILASLLPILHKNGVAKVTVAEGSKPQDGQKALMMAMKAVADLTGKK